MNQNVHLIARFVVVVVVAVILNGAEAKPPSRIVGGTEAVVGEFPYQASLRKFGRHRCGGTIISNRHILTAAHCVNGISAATAVGMTIMTGSNSLRAGVVSHVETITAHPDFAPGSRNSWRNDIAVLTKVRSQVDVLEVSENGETCSTNVPVNMIELENEIEFGLFTRAARLPENDTAADVECVVSGWGDLSYPYGWQPDIIRTAKMTTVSNARCGRDHPRVHIYDSQICASAPLGTGLCSGDSGGPLIHNGEVVGVASFVCPCGHGLPDVFTRVWFYRDFIINAMADE